MIWGDLDLVLSIRCVGSCTTKVARGSRRAAVYDCVKWPRVRFFALNDHDNGMKYDRNLSGKYGDL